MGYQSSNLLVFDVSSSVGKLSQICDDLATSLPRERCAIHWEQMFLFSEKSFNRVLFLSVLITCTELPSISNQVKNFHGSY